MHFVPIPTSKPEQDYKETALYKTSQFWLPFLPRIAKRGNEPVDQMMDAIVSGRIGIALVWDDATNEPRALVGIQLRRSGVNLIGEIVWLVGWGSKDWQGLLGELEEYLRDHLRCTIIKPICRPGWSRLLKSRGYSTTHFVMEKTL